MEDTRITALLPDDEIVTITSSDERKSAEILSQIEACTSGQNMIIREIPDLIESLSAERENEIPSDSGREYGHQGSGNSRGNRHRNHRDS